jgi:AGZA family xanthine/uracil permease-like MFS transporter
VPPALKYAVGAGIGLFLVLIGLVDAGIVQKGTPLITFGVFGTLQGWPILTFCLGLLLTIILVVRKVKGAILISIIATTIFAVIVESIAKVGPKIAADGAVNPVGWGLNVPKLPSTVFATPDFGLFWQFNLFGSWQLVGVIATVTAIFALILSDFFDTMGTVQGLAKEAGVEDEKGDIPHLTGILVVDSVAAIGGGVTSSSSNTAYIESGSGISEGARTGIASIVTGVLFLLAMFIAPLVTTVPYEAAAPALIIVGFLMFSQTRNIDFKDYTIGIPAFLTIVIMPFTYSIANGIGAGFISYAILMAVTGKAKKVGWLMWVVAALFLLYFMQTPIQGWFGVGA